MVYEWFMKLFDTLDKFLVLIKTPKERAVSEREENRKSRDSRAMKRRDRESSREAEIEKIGTPP